MGYKAAEKNLESTPEELVSQTEVSVTPTAMEY